jgi:hypothetical protein
MTRSDDMEHKALNVTEDKAVHGPKSRTRRSTKAAEADPAPAVVETAPDTTDIDAAAREVDDHKVKVVFAHYHVLHGKSYNPGDKATLPANIVEGLRAGGVIALG